MNEVRNWSARYNRLDIEVCETSDHHIFVAAASIRRVLPRLKTDSELKGKHGRALSQATKDGPLFFNEPTLRRELKHLESAEAQMFGDWLHHNIFYPAAKKRGVATTPAKFGEVEVVDHYKNRPAPFLGQAIDRRVHILEWFLLPLTLHWRGEVGLRKTLIESAIAAGLLAWLVGLGFDFVGDPDNYSGNWQVLKLKTLGLSIALLSVWIWWSVGATRAALNQVKANKNFSSALVVYLLGLLFMIHSLATALDDGQDWLRSMYSPKEVANISYDPASRRIVLKGSIGFGTYRALLRVLQEHPRAELLELTSPGGYAMEGFALARLVKASNLNTVTFRYCDSACTLIFAAGKKRLLGPKAVLGFHRSHVFGKPVLEGWSYTEHRMAKYLEDRGVKWQFIKTAFSYGGDEIWEPTHRDMVESGYATARWADME